MAMRMKVWFAFVKFSNRICFHIQISYFPCEISLSTMKFLHFELLYFVKYDVLSEYLTPFWFAMLLNEYEIEFMFRKIWNIRNLGNVHIGGPHIVMSSSNRCAERTWLPL